jgi:hypothetical protein
LESGSSDVVELDAVDPDGTGSPRNDGSRGSGLYAVAIRLKQTPSGIWAQLFPENWDHPQEYSSRHRPGIGRVSGSHIILNGTTIEEVRDVHTKTLKLAVAATNRQVAEYREKTKREHDAAEKHQQRHEANVRSVAPAIKFD